MGDAKLIEADLLARMMPLLQRAGRLTGGDLMVNTGAGATIRDLAVRLAYDPPPRDAAYTVMSVLYPAEDPPLTWWETAAGKAVAHAMGYHRTRVPVLQAAAILGVSRARIYQLIHEGVLEQVKLCPIMAVTPESLAWEMGERRIRARRARAAPAR